MKNGRFFGQESDSQDIEGHYYGDLGSGDQSTGCRLFDCTGHGQVNDGQNAGARNEKYGRLDRRSVGLCHSVDRSERRSGDQQSSGHGCHDANHVVRHDGRSHDCCGTDRTDRGHQKVADKVEPHLQGEGVQLQGSDREEVTALEAAGTER